jgi:hypothetical protein
MKVIVWSKLSNIFLHINFLFHVCALKKKNWSIDNDMNAFSIAIAFHENHI